MSGTKTSKARNWSIPVVNHTWLEDCFVQWKDVSVGLDKYISFPPSVDFAEILGERGIGPAIIQDTLWEWETALEAAHKGTDQETSPSKRRTAVEAAASIGTGVSAVEAREVEDAVTIEEDLAPMDIDNEAGAAPDEDMAVDAEPQGAEQTKDAAEDDEDDDDDAPVGVDSPTVSRL
ncbi:hypothetical protein EWM64_g738 [Hericium alpestre]|uniref:BRCT domain-containing protein n=1 Tax=Hericium alpestre TaxID=135208 RepID=A0A4Z0AAB6_9AGAM|nr:hypothetical protein EWM64_g738 [Hericium alpestre]